MLISPVWYSMGRSSFPFLACSELWLSCYVDDEHVDFDRARGDSGDKSVDKPLVWRGNIVYGERSDSLWYEIRATKLPCKFNKSKPFCPMTVRSWVEHLCCMHVALRSSASSCWLINSRTTIMDDLCDCKWHTSSQLMSMLAMALFYNLPWPPEQSVRLHGMSCLLRKTPRTTCRWSWESLR